VRKCPGPRGFLHNTHFEREIKNKKRRERVQGIGICQKKKKQWK